MTDKTIEMFKKEVEKLIASDISIQGEVSEETKDMALSVLTEHEYRTILQRESEKKRRGGIV